MFFFSPPKSEKQQAPQKAPPNTSKTKSHLKNTSKTPQNTEKHPKSTSKAPKNYIKHQKITQNPPKRTHSRRSGGGTPVSGARPGARQRNS
jgi:hypothetical protein